MNKLLFLSVVLLSLVVGCSTGPKLIPVSGIVTFSKDGSPAQFGTIEFRLENEPHSVARGKIQKDGSFKLKTGGQDGVVTGWHTVVITQFAGNFRGAKIAHNHGLDVAKKYADHRTTDLRMEITEESSLEALTLKVEDMPRKK